MTEIRHLRWSEVETEFLAPKLERRYISAGNVTIARFLLRKGLQVPEHSHENEQISYVLEGRLKFNFSGRELTVASGEMVAIPSNQPHSAEALDDCWVLDVFTPSRADWAAKQDQYLRESSVK